MADLGRALNIAVPQAISNISAIEDMQLKKRASQLNELTTMSNLATAGQEQTMNNMKINEMKVAQEKQNAMDKALKTPQTFQSMFQNVERYAPNTVSELGKHLTERGVVDSRGVLTPEAFEMWRATHPFEQQQFMQQGVAEIDKEIPTMQKLVTGYMETDDTGKPTKWVPPDKNVELISQQIEEKRMMQRFLLDQTGKLETEILKAREQGKIDIEKEMMKPKADIVEMEVDGKIVKVPASVAVASFDRKAQREQTEAIQEENRALRKLMHEENIAMRDEYRKLNYAYKDDAVMTGIVSKFNSDTTVKQTEKMDEFANLIVDVANSDNPIGHASLATLMARASGEVGNLSEADKKPFGGSVALDAKTKQYFKELYDGKKTPENLKFISDLAKTFQATGRRKKAEIAYERSNQYAQSNKKQGKTPQEIFSVLAPFENYDAIAKGKEQTIRVKLKSSGQTGTVPESEFDPNIYERTQ